MDVVNIRGTGSSIATGQEHERKPHAAGEKAGVAARGSSAPSRREQSPRDKVTLSQEAMEIRKLVTRDREVRTHEQAHAAAGGAFAGGPSYSFQMGPDGKRYAAGGEVPIDVSPVAGDPEATLKKAQTVRSAALAPARPSAQDQSIASQAAQMATNARAEILSGKKDDPGPEAAAGNQKPSSPTGASEPQRRRFSAVG